MISSILKSTLRTHLKQRTNLVVNLLGLSLGFAGGLVILLHVSYETRYEQWLDGVEHLYRIDSTERYSGRPPLLIARTPGPVAPALASNTAAVEDYTRGFEARERLGNDDRFFEQQLLAVDANFLNLITLPLLHGERSAALDSPNKIALSQSLAEKLFGSADHALGQRVDFGNPELADSRVSAIFKDLPPQSHLRFDALLPHQAYFNGARDEATQAIPSAWGGAYFHSYIKVRPNTDIPTLQGGLDQFIDHHLPHNLADILGVAPHEFLQLKLVAFRDIHLQGHPLAALNTPGNPTALALFTGVAALILLAAGINFSTLSSARLLTRHREFALRKTLGAGRVQLLFQLLLESTLPVLSALVLAMVLVEWCLPGLRNLATPALEPLKLGGQAAGVIYLAACLIITATVASTMRMTAQASSNQRYHPRHTRRDQALMFIQFSIAIGLLSASLIMNAQGKFTRGLDLGFEQDQRLILDLAERNDVESARERIKALPYVIDASLSSSVPGIASNASEANIAILDPAGGKSIPIGVRDIDEAFFNTYDSTLVAGRLFEPGRIADRLESASDTNQRRRGNIVINQQALATLGIAHAQAAIGQTLNTQGMALTVIGVIENMRFRSIHHEQRPELFITRPEPGKLLTVHYQAGQERTLRAFIEGPLSTASAVPRTYSLENTLGGLYREDHTQTRLMIVFTALALFIACMGLYAKSLFIIERHTLEVTLRKILGANVVQLCRLLIARLCLPIGIAALLVLPATAYLADVWLDGFSERIDLTPLPFILAALTAASIAGLTVIGQIHQLAKRRPSQAITQSS